MGWLRPNGIHWVKWEEVAVRINREAEGLGIRPLCEMNDALKSKWLWKFAKEEGAL